MLTPAEKAEQLAVFNRRLLQVDPDLSAGDIPRYAGLEVSRDPLQKIELESIILRKRRPVLPIKDGKAVLEFQDDSDGPIWKDRLNSSAPFLDMVIPSVGRIELKGNPSFSWVGTGWLVHPRFLVTNRHVAQVFAHREKNGFSIKHGPGGVMTVSIDMLQEIDSNETQTFYVKGVSYIEESSGLDLAFLEVEQIEGTVASPIELSNMTPTKNPLVAVIGYPAFDSRIPEPDLMKQIYGNVFDKKRLAPGAITHVEDDQFHHDCSTLGGNSGSLVVDLQTGVALGLHFSGSFLHTNFAVRGDCVKERLDALLNGNLPSNGESSGRYSMPRSSTSITRRVPRPLTNLATTSITIPLTVTLTLGESATLTSRFKSLPSPVRQDNINDIDDSDESDVQVELANYENRQGYVSSFLGNEFVVQLPTVWKWKTDILKWGNGREVLPYEHFSVVMNSKRRQCFFSACNIDGSRSKSSKRTAWKYDPRIPQKMQIMHECYGAAPKFSRGHMTRREDPAWGGTDSVIQRGADDSMHVTNATPQMQAFNSPIWLALEDYALENARVAEQRISVFTGPYFTDSDPLMYGVRIPTRFWKVIVFIHDYTGELCSTGYEMSQEQNLEPLEFVFGNFISPQLNVSTQVPISMIEARAGISFDRLSEVDPMSCEGLPESTGPLLFPEQIRYI